jgi:hypothetical protein
VITGFNTDVEYQGVTYHVQTEDKGVSTPMIMSLVYVRGTIIASKRTPYEDLLNGKLDEKVLAGRLQKQHQLICAAVKAGRIEDLKRMAAKDPARQKKPAPAPAQVPAPEPQVAAPVPVPVKVPPQPFLEASKNLADAIDRVKLQQPVVTTPPPRPAAPVKPPPVVPEPVPKPEQDLEWGFPIDLTEDDLIIDGVEIVDDDMILPAEAVAILGDIAASAQTGPGKLGVDFVSETSFKGGERKTLGIVIYRGSRANPVASAQIMVKVLGSSFRPLIFHAKTDEKGVATVHLQLPHFKAGRAAVLVRAMSEGEEAEIRRRVAHG